MFCLPTHYFKKAFYYLLHNIKVDKFSSSYLVKINWILMKKNYISESVLFISKDMAMRNRLRISLKECGKSSVIDMLYAPTNKIFKTYVCVKLLFAYVALSSHVRKFIEYKQ